MKKMLFVVLVSFGLASNTAFANERDYANLKSEEIQVKDNGAIGIQRPNKLNDTIVLIKGIDKSANLSQFSESQVNQEIVQFFERLVTQYKFKQSDRPKIAYGALGDGWFGKGLYQLEISEIIRLNNRDFGKNDMNLVDSNGNKFVPLKVLFSQIRVINPGSLTEDKNSTVSLQNYVQSYKFGGSLGIGESMVENSWNGIYDNNTSSTGSYTLVKSEKGSFDGVVNKYISCEGGGIRVVTVNESIGFYADSNGKRHSDFHSAAQASCQN